MPNVKISRTLFVGLGGTGVKAILRAKQCFVDAYGEVPPMVAFLAVDTDKKIRDASLPSRKGRDVKFAENEICFCGITGSALDIYRNHLTQFQWLPRRNAAFLANLKNTGAGAVRSSGRFLARHNAIEIGNRVASKVTEIGRPLPIGSKFVYDTNKDGVEYPVKVNVVGSVAGGTGSGTILDMLILIAKTLRNSGLSYSITPWLVLPEVFRHMAPGPASANVYQNAYGAIRELDYLYHLPKANQNALDFNFDKVYYLDEGIGDTYLINNTNKAGVVFQNIDDITDSIGRCMFLPSNEVDSVKDNTDNVSFVYNIRNKEAHYVSAGSAEIVYDNQAVGNVIAKGIIAQICNELCKTSSVDALKEVNAWTNSEAVAIQEHDADLLTDSILPKYAPFSIIIGKDADGSTIDANIFAGADAPNVHEEVKNNELKKFENVKIELKKKIEEILNTQNGIGAAQAFLESLSDNIAICKDEMNSEASDLSRSLAYTFDWNAEISVLRSGLFKTFDKDAADVLQSKISEYIAQKRDLLRHKWAIQFFTDLDTYINELSENVSVLKSIVEATERRQRRDINAIQQRAKSDSKFQIYLHSADVDHFVLPNVNETSALFRNLHPIYTLFNKTEDELCDILFNFTKNQQSVISAVNVTIEDKMRSMTEEQLKIIFAKVKEMSSPLWSTNTQGYLDRAQELTTVFTIGVYDQSSGILKDKYIDDFTLGTIKPTFATTHENDRITFFQSQCYSPAYAVNNMIGYLKEAEEKFKSESYPVCYLDEMWYQRMIVEGFDIMPKQEKDRVLPNWANAIVYGFIKYNEDRKTYYIESEQGDILSGGFLELGQRRDLAFDQFQIRGLDKEVESRLQQMILEQGRPAVTAVIKSAKSNIRNYVSQLAQLSTIEYDRIIANDPAYKMVRDMLEKEVIYLKELDV
ncbi:MAG: hypothetical protein IKX22_07640 [Prevotella sp.]|nr:hypothetical protein [Prevotella sp.]